MEVKSLDSPSLPSGCQQVLFMRWKLIYVSSVHKNAAVLWSYTDAVSVGTLIAPIL